MIRFSLACSMLLALVSGTACDVENEPSPSPAAVYPVVNGTPTDYRSWQGVVMVETVLARCTGTLVHPRVVLTAAHCIRRAPDGTGLGYDLTDRPDQVRIAGGPEGKTVRSGIDRIEIHPDWTGEFSFQVPDAALLLLTEPLEDLPIYRLRKAPLPEVGDPGVIVGYGIDPTDSVTEGPLHRMGETEILQVLPAYFEIGGETNTCTGDSGGPLFTRQNGDWVLTGITSFGPAECPAETDGYDVNLLPLCDWLDTAFAVLTGEAALCNQGDTDTDTNDVDAGETPPPAEEECGCRAPGARSPSLIAPLLKALGPQVDFP